MDESSDDRDGSYWGQPDLVDNDGYRLGDGTWVCPNCWACWSIYRHCPNCGPNPPIGLYRHPPVDPVTGEISAADNAVRMGNMRHCDVPGKFRQEGCIAVMDDHGWIDSPIPVGGVTVCPPAYAI